MSEQTTKQSVAEAIKIHHMALNQLFGDGNVAMMIASHRWLGWPVLVFLAALVAGCGSGEKDAERRPSQPNDGAKVTRSPEEGGVQQAREPMKLPVEPQDWPRILTERIN